MDTRTPKPPSPDRETVLSKVLENPHLPSPPALVLQIVEKASKPDCDPAEVISLLSKDSGLCGQVLKTVNSGLFGLAKSVTSLKQAVLMLGVKPLRSLVLSLALPAFRVSSRDGALVRYWQESVAGAVIAFKLAELLRRKDPDDDLIAGLLRDVGMLIFQQAFPEEYSDLWKKASTIWVERQCEVETEAFGFDHAELSAVIIESWHLPREIFLPIQYHHAPEGCTAEVAALQQRAWVLSFASKVATLHTSSTTTVTELVQFAKKHFGLDQLALVKFLGSVTPAIQEFAGLLKVDIGKCPNYSDIITTGCQELVRLSVETSRVVHRSIAEPMKNKAQDDDFERTQSGKLPGGELGEGNSALPDFDISILKQLPPGGARLGGYEIKELLGRGGMGVVFKAYDPLLARFAAIKMMLPEAVAQEKFRKWFTREARAAAGIQHENVVTIYLVNESKGIPYIVMEYLSGPSLEGRIERDGPLPWSDVFHIGIQIAGGLAAAHRRKIIHRDIKPANVLFGGEAGQIKIVDFGLVLVTDDVNRSAQQGNWVGTPLYMSPEQFNGVDVDHRSDLFSLGSLLYNLSTGKPPFVADRVPILMQKIRNEQPIPLRSVRSDVPAWFVHLVSKLHAKAPGARFQSAAELVQEFAKHM